MHQSNYVPAIYFHVFLGVSIETVCSEDIDSCRFYYFRCRVYIWRHLQWSRAHAWNRNQFLISKFTFLLKSMSSERIVSQHTYLSILHPLSSSESKASCSGGPNRHYSAPYRLPQKKTPAKLLKWWRSALLIVLLMILEWWISQRGNVALLRVLGMVSYLYGF